MDVVHDLINVKKFCKHTLAEKKELKARGRPLPDMVIESTGSSRGKTYKRQFSREIYSRNKWICGCNKKNALYCFPCVLFGGNKSWSQSGVTDLVHLTEKIKKHESSFHHLYNQMEWVLLGTVDIQVQLHSAYWKGIQKRNEDVTRNRWVFTNIINCIKFCDAFELAHQEYEADSSLIPREFGGLINLAAKLDKILEDHLKPVKTVKERAGIQNDLLDCILEVCHVHIISEIKEAPFLAIMADETTDVSGESQMVTIFRYTTKNGERIERFWSCLQLSEHDAESLTKSILSVVDPMAENSPNKLIAQSYCGAAVMCDEHTGLQAKVREKYPFAHFIHRCDDQLKSIMSANAQIRLFFGNLQVIPRFFNNALERVALLDDVVRRKNPHSAPAAWNFNIRTVNVVFEHRESIIDYMQELEKGYNDRVCSQASIIRRTLQDSMFVFWLTFFRHIMPRIDDLSHQLQRSKNDATKVTNAIDTFEQKILGVRDNVDDIINEASELCMGPQTDERHDPGNSRVAAVEACDVVIKTARGCFAYKEHLVAQSLFLSEKFKAYFLNFPSEQLNAICLVYPTLDRARLETELSVIYSRTDCIALNGALPLLQMLIQYNLEDSMRETKKLLEILVTTPTATAEAELSFSTLRRVKNFLRNSISRDRLTALAMISVEKQFISTIANFNELVIDKFSTRKECRVDLIYKNTFEIKADTKFKVDQHAKTATHLSNLRRLENEKKDLQSGTDSSSTTTSFQKEFHEFSESTDLPTEHPSTSSEHPPAADESVLIDHIKKEEEYDDIFDETVDDVLQVTKEELMDIVNQSETGSDVDDRFTEVSPKKEPIYSDQEGDSEPPSKKRKSKDDETRPPLNDKAGPSHRSSLDRELRQESINLVQTIQQDPELAEMLDSSGNIDLFFESILALAKTLSPLDQVILQRNIANVIFGMKITQLMRKK